MGTGGTHRTAIVIAAYNAEATIGRAVASALAEPEVVEVCVVDDGSRDATVEAARACDAGDGRLTVISQPVNAGPSAARNAAIEATTAPWIGILDADDYLLPGRTKALLAHADEADMVADVLLRASGGADDPAPADAWPLAGDGPATVSFEEFVRGNLTMAHRGLELGFLKPLVRRSFLDRHGLRYRPDMRLGEDYELYARALALGARYLVTRAAGYVSVERAGSLSKIHSERDLLLLRDCDEALRRIRDLTPSERRVLARHTESVDCRLQWRLLINAVKARDFAASLRTFRSPQTALYLAACLGEQAWLRGWRLLGRSAGIAKPAGADAGATS